MSIYLYIAMIGLFYSYVIWIALKYGVQCSVSQSWYILPQKDKWIFNVVTWLYGILAFAIFPSIYSAIGMIGLLLVGSMPSFRDNKQTFVHILGATISMVSSQLVIIFVLGLPIISFITLVALLMLEYTQDLNIRLKEAKTWWLEIIVFTSLAISYGIKL